MTTGSPTIQKRNAQLVGNLTPDFTRRSDFDQNGSRLLSDVFATHREGGGPLIYGFDAQKPGIETYIGSLQWTTAGITFSSWEATTNGGPYGVFNGQSSVLYRNDASWQEVSDATLGTDETLLVWHWTYTNTLASTQAASSKWDNNGDNRSWLLQLSSTPDFKFRTSDLGTAASIVDVTSTTTPVADTWYFVAGYWQASTLLRIFVGLATDGSLQIDSNAASIPASLYDGSAPLAIGAAFNNAPALIIPWSGNIGPGTLRFGVPAAAINGYVSRLFHQTRWFYQ
jgi:hypothetical protein